MKHATAAVLLMAAIIVGTGEARADTNINGVEGETSSTGTIWKPCHDDSLPDAFTALNKCVWDAKHMGNGKGQSYFTNARGWHPISHRRAHRMLVRSCDEVC